MGVLTTAPGNTKISQILNKNTSTYFRSVSLDIWPLTALKGTQRVIHFEVFYAHMKSFLMDSLQRSKQSDNKQEKRWFILIENLTYFFIP